MRKTLKFLHTLGAIGYAGAAAALLVLHAQLPAPEDLERFAALRMAMGAVAQLILLPSIAVVLVSGLLAMAFNPAFHNAGWVWLKLIFGVLVFEGTLVSVQAPMERAALQAEAALAGDVPVAELLAPLGPEWGSLWVVLLLAVFNVVLGVWRPRSRGRPGTERAAAGGGRFGGPTA
ncbi:hypothetical protein [Pseudohaliea rubra]|uniref:DUF2269 family protein n=1 Tax=Pseudohaliea rubra DSM 19751 TaxID=1265313 RepID=A0A095XXF9_9GAMM|nr:hypothetical protein [Pseudohaliea rubra]KGE04411.1 hypothetical protein HRUBRA_00995 [Pseudohaliea rubra DSM 19751]